MGQNGKATISYYINQLQAELIGYQCFYNDGSNEFCPLGDKVKEVNGDGAILVDIKQVGKSWKKDFYCSQCGLKQSYTTKCKCGFSDSLQRTVL